MQNSKKPNFISIPLIQGAGAFETKKPSCLSLGNPAISLRPMAFRPFLAKGLAFSKVKCYCSSKQTLTALLLKHSYQK
jgi:hypothetical protein